MIYLVLITQLNIMIIIKTFINKDSLQLKNRFQKTVISKYHLYLKY